MPQAVDGHLIIRADATAAIGTGHVMRCLSLAGAWIARGGTAELLGHVESIGVRQRITDAGLPLIDDNASARTLRAHFEKNTNPNRWLVLDGYQFDTAYQKTLEKTGRLVVIDDMAHLPEYAATVFLNQNIDAKALPYKFSGTPLKLFGPQFALLRPEFSARRGKLRVTRDRAERIFVTFGGSDPQNATGAVLEALEKLDPGLTCKVVLGPVNPNIHEVRALAKRSPQTIEILQDVTDMAELMAWADIAISAAGSTTWELACLGVPSVLVVVADNQAGIGAGMAKKGAAFSVGEPNPEKIAGLLGELIDASVLRAQMTTAAGQLVDGLGTHRVIDVLCEAT